jgi:hypothetical protein
METKKEFVDFLSQSYIEFDMLSHETIHLCDNKFLYVYKIKVKTWEFDEMLIDFLLDKTDLAWNYERGEKRFYIVNFYFFERGLRQ